MKIADGEKFFDNQIARIAEAQGPSLLFGRLRPRVLITGFGMM
jgi:hypothetical protein